MSLILVSLCGLISCVSHHKHLLVHLSCHSITKTKLGPFTPSLPRPPASSSSFSAPTPLRHAPRPHAAPSAASFSVCSTSPCPRCGSASRPSPQATRRGADSSGVRREGVNLRREKEQWREGRVQFNSIQQCHIHPNGCFHIRTHFNTWPDLVLGSIQY